MSHFQTIFDLLKTRKNKFTVLIMQGMPGAGKTFLVDQIKEAFPDITISVSADDYFKNSEGDYQFDASKLGDAHNQCLRNFVSIIQEQKKNIVIVDNTHTKVEEAAPYVALSGAFGYQHYILSVRRDFKIACKECQHNVPIEKQRFSFDNVNNFKTPKRWNLLLTNSTGRLKE